MRDFLDLMTGSVKTTINVVNIFCDNPGKRSLPIRTLLEPYTIQWRHIRKERIPIFTLSSRRGLCRKTIDSWRIIHAFRFLNRGWEERGGAYFPLEVQGAWLPDAAEAEKPGVMCKVTLNIPLKWNSTCLPHGPAFQPKH